MLPQLLSFTALLYTLSVISLAAAHPDGRHGSFAKRHNSHNQLHNRLNSLNPPIISNLARQVAGGRRIRNSCSKKSQPLDTPNSTIISSTVTTQVVPTPVLKSTSASSTVTKSANLVAGATQAGAVPAAVRTSLADPFLLELSKSYNNANNALFNKVHVGEMTFYGQGLGACGDTYDDSSFTAAVSKLMYDAWPGATESRNRNPICGPYVPGRKILNQLGVFVTAVPGPEFVNIGGDGLINCDLVSQCHVPLTATVKHGGKSIQVKIVDRCEACAEGDIDLTPAAYAALADVGLGRTSVEWFFNK